jgi:hypothetical protein
MSIKPYGTADENIAHYTCYRTPNPIAIDGNANKPAWQHAPRSSRFVDMVTGRPAFFDTRAAALWDDENFYVAFWAEEPFVEAQLTERDALVFFESDLEVFIDGGDTYYEFEINAHGTVYEVFYIWREAYTRGGKFDVPEFDVHSPQVHSFAGDHPHDVKSFWRGAHPRGTRWAFLNWDFPGLRTAVQIEGTLNDNTDIDKGWLVELAFPWAGMQWLANGRSLPPKDGDTWRMFFGRFQKLEIKGQEVQPHPGWAWNPHGIADTHLPECFTYIHFSDQVVGALTHPPEG